MVQTISMRQLEEILEGRWNGRGRGDWSDGYDFILLDVRDPVLFESGHLNGAVNIPLEELEIRVDELPRGKMILIYCGHGSRSLLAARLLDSLGFRAVSVLGGLSSYRGRHFGAP